MFYNQAWIKSPSILTNQFLKSKNSHALPRLHRPVGANGALPPPQLSDTRSAPDIN